MLNLLSRGQLIFLAALLSMSFDFSLISSKFKKKTPQSPLRIDVLSTTEDSDIITLKLSDLEKEELAQQEKLLDSAKDICNYFESNNYEQVFQNRTWELVDGMALHVGNDSFTLKEVAELAAIQKYLENKSADVFSFDPGLLATKALSLEADLLGCSNRHSETFEDFLNQERVEFKTSDHAELSKQLKKNYGFSLGSFINHFSQREIALTMLSRLNQTKKPDMKAFHSFLSKKGIVADLIYNIDIKILNKELLQNNSDAEDSSSDWVSFGFVQPDELHPVVAASIKKLDDGATSERLLIDNEYWLVKLNSTDLLIADTSLNKMELFKEMSELWLKAKVADLGNKIASKPAKTILLGNVQKNLL